jgi:DNA mismatch endonuclease, patch repair protein
MTNEKGSDVFSPEKRSRIMSNIKSKNTTPEMIVRSLLHKLGFRFRVHKKELPGNPDIVLPKYRTAIFVHGCFWHQHEACKRAKMPKHNRDYWENKLAKNKERDLKARDDLQRMGWNVIELWECEIKRGIDEEEIKARILRIQ